MEQDKEYTAKLSLIVKMRAFEEDDAVEIISDLFSPGDFYGIEIVKCELSYVAEEEVKE